MDFSCLIKSNGRLAVLSSSLFNWAIEKAIYSDSDEIWLFKDILISETIAYDRVDIFSDVAYDAEHEAGTTLTDLFDVVVDYENQGVHAKKYNLEAFLVTTQKPRTS